jgi:hypothetical protein
LLMSQGFRTSAPEAQNGFMGGRIVSSRSPRRNIRGRNVNIFNAWKIRGMRRETGGNTAGRAGGAVKRHWVLGLVPATSNSQRSSAKGLAQSAAR